VPFFGGAGGPKGPGWGFGPGWGGPVPFFGGGGFAGGPGWGPGCWGGSLAGGGGLGGRVGLGSFPNPPEFAGLFVVGGAEGGVKGWVGIQGSGSPPPVVLSLFSVFFVLWCCGLKGGRGMGQPGGSNGGTGIPGSGQEVSPGCGAWAVSSSSSSFS